MSSIVIKVFNCDGTGSVRRRKFDTSSVTLAQVQDIGKIQSDAKLTWRDEDNDTIVIETQSDLQEAIACATAQKSTLRLFVENAKPSPTPTPASDAATPQEPTPAQPPSDCCRTAQPFRCRARQHFIYRHELISTIKRARSAFASTINRARSAFVTSAAWQATKDDVCSIRSVFEARVERNLSTFPILPIAGFVTHFFLIWALISPSFWLLSQIAIGAMLFPRNALANDARRSLCCLCVLIGFRVAMKLLSCLLPTFLIFGFTCCLVPKIIIGLTFWGCIRSKCRARQHIRKGRHLYRQRTPHAQTASSAAPSAPLEQEHIAMIRKIFPTIDADHLRQTYMRHKDVQQTVNELLQCASK